MEELPTENPTASLIFPELPEGYVWRTYSISTSRFSGDVDLWLADADEAYRGLVAWVSCRGFPVLAVKNRNTETNQHGNPVAVSSYQEGINLIHAQLMLGLIGKGKCLQE